MKYDYIIAGGGCAGLSLAYYLSKSTLRDKRVLIIDADEKQGNDRTWCYWSDKADIFEDIVFKQWPVLSFIDEKGEREGALGLMRYKMIRSIDFYRKVKTTLAALPNVKFLRGLISDMDSTSEGACVQVGEQRFEGSWVFNSCFRGGQEAAVREKKHHFLLQHFTGWWIRCDKPQFDPGKGILMDFRTPQYNSTRFFYLLPVSEREALVEYTIFSPHRLHQKSYERALEAYLSDTLGIEKYEITEREKGAIPMTDKPFPAALGARIVNLGTVGGAVKPTTGYAFKNIQQQAQRIVQQLENENSPLGEPLLPTRFQFYDSLLLNILQDHGQHGKVIFSQLFHRNRMTTILRFLEERSHVGQEARIFSSLPLLPFLRALVRVKLSRGLAKSPAADVIIDESRLPDIGWRRNKGARSISRTAW